MNINPKLFTPLREEFLNQVSTKTRQTYRIRLKRFFKYLEEQQITDLEQVEKYLILQYCKEVLEPRKILKETKQRTYGLIRRYFDFIYENKAFPHKYELPILYNFTEWITPDLLERRSKELPEIFDLSKIILHAKKINVRMYIYLVLMAFNGARDSEIRSIKLADIHEMTAQIRLKSGLKSISFIYFLSGSIDKHMKKGQVIYFVPKQLYHSHEWKFYLEQVKLFKTPVFLFQTHHDPRFIVYRCTNRNLKNYAQKEGLGDLRWSTHIFRNVLNEKRMEMGCDSALRSILLNQTPSGTNAKHYLKKCNQIQRRYQYWEKFTPPDLLEIF